MKTKQFWEIAFKKMNVLLNLQLKKELLLQSLNLVGNSMVIKKILVQYNYFRLLFGKKIKNGYPNYRQ